MLFTEAIFLFGFLPLLLLVYFLAPHWARNSILFVASLFFYAWGEGKYVAVMLGSIAMNWVFALLVGAATGVARKTWLAAAVTANLILLGYFKYANFLAQNLGGVVSRLGFDPGWTEIGPIHLPIGISFFTFQAISYVIDVSRRVVPPERNLLRMGLFKTLFPQLIAGPIVRYVHIHDELPKRWVDSACFAEGVRRFILGLSKKMLIANQLALVADALFGRPAGELSASLAWLGAVCYMGQIYFDFSGYSDMAIGLGRMFGFRFPENFNHPYTADSITDFWRRWHMSLSSWFRDYLYIPLGGNRVGPLRVYFNLMAVFFLCGFWHGAAWTFIAWGLYNGLFLVAERRLGLRPLDGRAPIWRHIYVFLVVLVGWVFFRANSMTHATAYLAAMAGLGSASSPYSLGFFLTPSFLIVFVAAILFSTPVPAIVLRRLRLWTAGSDERGLPSQVPTGLPGLLSTAGLMGLMLLSVVKIAEQSYNPFIYFRF